ncbi:MAG: hypothetical protein JJU05_17220 [Verrucomicrobia bacterium]|nr:hypothetical protein [Verrucomicrobiota bacterium]MCH8527186.1 hypothetical protein [Kiritimatiellia bacterium]
MIKIKTRILLVLLIIGGIAAYTISYLRLRVKRIQPRHVAIFFQHMDLERDTINEFQSTHAVPDWFVPYNNDDKVFLIQNSRRDQALALFYSPVRFIDKWITGIENSEIPDMKRIGRSLILRETVGRPYSCAFVSIRGE